MTQGHAQPLPVQGPICPSADLHLSPLRGGHLGVVHLDLARRHLVQTLRDDPQGLAHLLHSTQVPDGDGAGDRRGCDTRKTEALPAALSWQCGRAAAGDQRLLTRDWAPGLSWSQTLAAFPLYPIRQVSDTVQVRVRDSERNGSQSRRVPRHRNGAQGLARRAAGPGVPQSSGQPLTQPPPQP